MDDGATDLVMGTQGKEQAGAGGAHELIPEAKFRCLGNTERRSGVDSRIYKFGSQGMLKVQVVSVEPWVKMSLFREKVWN